MLVCLLAVSEARATVPDQYGTGGRSIAMGGGGVAVVSDGTAAYVNPAGLYQIRRPTVSIAFSAAMPKFDPIPKLWWDTNRDGEVDDRDDPLDYDASVDPAVGLHLSAGRNVGGRFGIGISAYVPADHLLRLKTFEPSLPNYFMYDNRPQRYVFSAGLGGRVLKGVAVGAGIDFVPRAKYDISMTVDASITGADSQDDDLSDLVTDVTVDVHEMDLDLQPAFAPIVGVQLDIGKWFAPLDGLWLAAAYHGQVGLPIDVNLDLQANVKAENIGDLDPFVFPVIMQAALGIYDHYVPAQVRLGAAWRNEDTLTAYVDARYTEWEPMVLNVARLTNATLESPLVDLSDAIHDGNDYTVILKNTWSIRSGAEILLPRIELHNRFKYLRIMARGGFGYEPTPLVSQGASSALLDADRTLYATGLGIEFWDPLKLVDAPVRLDAFGQYQMLASGSLPRSASEPTAGYPVDGSSIPIGGHVVLLGVQWGFDY